ncbi:serine/threonine-protein kinase [Candidatus Uabimicrobium amorphum]|uniref:Protein kinase n=1 Tax=Uabimicrobium amorphum TaxID=2596890 RepID=A0A5S9F402_UABAM|nr:serine/threonine-protein kinase [Candidatus Uabimicrobium amorphum]BBM84069.1 protein kinase [Candidatus Uabimicrobium amorphum]
MSQTWFVKSNKNGKVFGPYTQELLQKYIEEGRINRNEYVISADNNTWHDINANATPAIESMQQQLGKYNIIKELGRGGMGIVFQAEDTQLQRMCALKVLLPELRCDLQAVQRFQSEAKAVAQIQHPGIIQIYEICQTPQYFFAMAYVEGQTLTQYIQNKSMDDKLKVFYLVCDAIEFAHSKKILHRDLKPDNILVDQSGVPIILDFGIAKHIGQSTDLTKTGDVFGTPKYMSPETAKGEKVDQRSDIYSLGVILYEILTGTVPFTGENYIELLFHLTTSDPIPPSKINVSIPRDGDLEIVCLTALAKDPKKRIPDAAFLKSEIHNIIHKNPIKLKPPTAWQKFGKWRKKNPVVLATFTAMLIIVCVALSTMFLEQRHSQKLQRQTQNEMANIKIEAIHSTLETIDAEMAAQNIFDSYNKITRCYRYLSEIINTISPKKAQNLHQLLNMHLRFDILNKFPKVTEKKLPQSPYPPICSPQNKYIIKMYIANNVPNYYIWENTQQQFTLENMYLKISHVHNYNAVLFSPNNQYLMLRLPKDTFAIFDLEKRQQIFSTKYCIVEDACFSADSRYCAFRFEKANDKRKERACHLLNLSTGKIRKFPIEVYGNMLISPNGNWFIIQEKQQKKLIIHNIINNKNYEYTDDIFKYTCRMCFTEEKNKVFIVSNVNMSILNLKKNTLVSSPSLLLGNFISAGPILTVDSHYAMGKKDGKLILAKKNINDSIFQQRLPSYFNMLVSHLKFHPQNFLVAIRNDIIELRDIYTGNVISTFAENGTLHSMQLQSQNGLKLSLTKSQSYKEYTIAFEKLQINDAGIKKILSRFKSLMHDLDPTLAMIAYKDIFIYTGHIGFIIWRNGKCIPKPIFEDISRIKYDIRNEQLFIHFASGRIDIYDARNGLSVRTFKSRIRRAVADFAISRYQDCIYISYNSPCRVVKENLDTKTEEILLETQGSTKKILELDKDTLLVASETWDYTKMALYVLRAGKPHTRILPKVRLNKIVALAADKTNTCFAAGDNIGNIYVWNGLSPKTFRTAKVNGTIKGLSFSPMSEYLSVTTKENVHIYSTKDLDKRFEIYRGFFKEKGVIFSKDWKKAYIPDGLGEIMIFDQSFLIDDEAMFRKIEQCDQMISAKTNEGLMYYMNKIENVLNNTK